MVRFSEIQQFPEFSGNFSGKFLVHLLLFPNFLKFWLNGKHPCFSGRNISNNGNLCSISSEPSLISISSLRGRFSLNGTDLYKITAKAIPRRNLPVLNFGYHLPGEPARKPFFFEPPNETSKLKKEKILYFQRLYGICNIVEEMYAW